MNHRQDIGAADFVDYGFVAAHFHILACQYKRCPDKRVEPMNGQSKKRQCFHNMVESFDVVLLMEDDILLLLVAQIAG